jgi:hypothetical protein
MQIVESLVVLGPPRAGKDTLVSGVTGQEYAKRYEHEVIAPLRWSTRPHRSSDRSSEWVHKSHEEFQEGIAEGLIAPSWTRSLDIGKGPERYGFLSVSPEDPRLRIYSANFAILQRPNEATEAMLAKAAIVLVTARVETLLSRLAEIASEMPPLERRARTRKISQDIPALHYPVVGIHTDGTKPEEGQELFRHLVDDVLSGWAPPGYEANPPPQLPGSVRPELPRPEQL